MKDFFDIVILIGRPASGKSEIIDFLQKTPVEERRKRFHIGHFVVLDDFPMIWTWFEEDAILEKVFNKPRLHTDREGYFLYPYLWHLLIRRLCLDYDKKLRDDPNFPNQYTAIIEFSRGKEHGGYREAFQHLSEEVLSRAVLLYVDVPFEESLKRNRRRFNPLRPHSILEHSLPDEKLEKLYHEVDWEEVSKDDSEFLSIKGSKIPYAVFKNYPELTDKPDLLGPNLERVFGRLWSLLEKRGW